jgi:hypothetical protein
MSKNFADEGVPEILDMVGDGKLSGTLTIDQVYAKYQHERLDLHHPRGGKARYLADPFVENYRLYLQRIADHVLEPDGMVDAMADVLDSLSSASARETPVEFYNLARSHGVVVRDRGAIARQRRPAQGRLSKDELREQRKGRRSRGNR